LLQVLQRSADRRRFCPTLIAALTGYCVLVSAFIAQCDVNRSFFVEKG
jgi:hypothetical protein